MATDTRNATESIVANTSKIISEARTSGKRIVLEINNLNAAGGNDVFVSVGEEAVLNKGRRLQPGQTITWSQESGYKLPQDRITAISAANTDLAIYEEIEVK